MGPRLNDAVSDVAPVLQSDQAAGCRCGLDSTRRPTSAARRRARQGHVWRSPGADALNDEPASTLGLRPRPAPCETERLLMLVRELQGEVARKSELAASWRTRAELLAEDLAEARRYIDGERDLRPWWRRWLWALAPCLAISLLLI
jgi:hypothetical protein